MKYVLNMELKKICLETSKEEYQELTEEQKKTIKSNFLFSRRSGGWVSRCKWPNTGYAERILKALGAEDGGTVGEVLTFSEQMENKAERAERRADKMEYRSEKANKEGERLQAPINSMHGDISFFTQPNINTSAGRAFTKKRDAMWAAYDRGFEEFKKSAYYQARAEAARTTYKNVKAPSVDFCQRRIEDAQKAIRAHRKQIAIYENYLETLEAGKPLVDSFGWKINLSAEDIERYLNKQEILLNEAIEKEIYYREIQESQGGVQFSKANIKPGYIVSVKKWGAVEVVSTGPKNFSYKVGNGFPLSDSYAVIEKVIKAEEAKKPVHPFKTGEKYNVELLVGNNFENIPVEIVKATDKSITILNLVTGKKTVRQPKLHEDYRGKKWWEVWVSDNYHSRFTKAYEG